MEVSRRRIQDPDRRIKKKLAWLDQVQNTVYQPCDICGGTFNHDALPNNQYMGKWYCAWCKTRNAIKIIQMMVVLEKVAKRPCKKKQTGFLDENFEDCGKCPECVAKKILPFPTPEQFEMTINQKIRNLSY